MKTEFRKLLDDAENNQIPYKVLNKIISATDRRECVETMLDLSGTCEKIGSVEAYKLLLLQIQQFMRGNINKNRIIKLSEKITAYPNGYVGTFMNLFDWVYKFVVQKNDIDHIFDSYENAEKAFPGIELNFSLGRISKIEDRVLIAKIIDCKHFHEKNFYQISELIENSNELSIDNCKIIELNCLKYEAEYLQINIYGTEYYRTRPHQANSIRLNCITKKRDERIVEK